MKNETDFTVTYLCCSAVLIDYSFHEINLYLKGGIYLIIGLLIAVCVCSDLCKYFNHEVRANFTIRDYIQHTLGGIYILILAFNLLFI